MCSSDLSKHIPYSLHMCKVAEPAKMIYHLLILENFMLYKMAHVLRDHTPWLWNLANRINAFLFVVRYGKKLEAIEHECLLTLERELMLREKHLYKICPMRDVAAKKISSFFARQPYEAFKYFKPHNFDIKSIEFLKKNRAFLAYVIIDTTNNQIAGYCFNRSFFHGKGFRGRMVDIEYRGRGLGTMMNHLLNTIGFGIGLRLFETVSKNNKASYRSTISSSNYKILKELPENEVYLEILNNMKHNDKHAPTLTGGVK